MAYKSTIFAGGSTAGSLATTGSPVIVSGSAAPSTGQVLEATSPTTATWQTPGGAGIPVGPHYISISQSTGLAVADDASFHSLSFDTNSSVVGVGISHSTSVNQDRITATLQGYLTVNVSLLWPNNTSGGRFIYIAKNGVAPDDAIGNGGSALSGSSAVYNGQSATFYMSPGDYITILVRQTSGTTLTLASGFGVFATLTAMGGGGPSPVSANVAITSNQTGIATGVRTNVAWSGTFGTGGNIGTVWSAGNPTRLTAPSAGRYLIVSHIYWDTTFGNTGNIRATTLQKNGSYLSAGQTMLTPLPGAPFQFDQVSSYVVDLEINDYIEIGVYQDSGNPGVIIGNGTNTQNSTWASFTRINDGGSDTASAGLEQSGAQTITSNFGSTTILSGGTWTQDWNSGCSISLGSGSISVPIAGTYIIGVQNYWSSNPGDSWISVVLNGVAEGGSPSSISTQTMNSNTSFHTASFVRRLSANDTIQIGVRQSSGSSKNINSVYSVTLLA
jgi:hypothetical protein